MHLEPERAMNGMVPTISKTAVALFFTQILKIDNIDNVISISIDRSCIIVEEYITDENGKIYTNQNEDISTKITTIPMIHD